MHVRIQSPNKAIKSTTPSSQHHALVTVYTIQSASRSSDGVNASRSRTPPAQPFRRRAMCPAHHPSSPLHGAKHPSNIDRVPDHTNWCAIAEPRWCNVNTSAGRPLRRSLRFRRTWLPADQCENIIDARCMSGPRAQSKPQKAPHLLVSPDPEHKKQVTTSKHTQCSSVSITRVRPCRSTAISHTPRAPFAAAQRPAHQPASSSCRSTRQH